VIAPSAPADLFWHTNIPGLAEDYELSSDYTLIGNHCVRNRERCVRNRERCVRNRERCDVGEPCLCDVLLRPCCRGARASGQSRRVTRAGTGDSERGRNALETIRELPGEVDLLLNDGFPMRGVDIVKLVAPKMSEGAVVLTDNVGTFKANYREYVAYMRNPGNGFSSMTVPFRSGTEYSVHLRGDAHV
jgi:hypothetical protein